MHKYDRDSPTDDDTGGLLGRIIAQADRISSIDKRLKLPTHPFYDSTNFPDEATYGQLVIDKDNPSAVWIYGKDDAWHKIGGIEWCIATSNITTIVPGDNDLYPLDFDKPPGSGTSFFTNSPNIFSSDLWTDDGAPVTFAGHRGVGVHAKGSYLMLYQVEFTGVPVGKVCYAESFATTYAILSTVNFSRAVAIAGNLSAQLKWFELNLINNTGLAPFIIGASQNSGGNCQVYPSIFIIRLSSDTFGLV